MNLEGWEPSRQPITHKRCAPNTNTNLLGLTKPTNRRGVHPISAVLPDCTHDATASSLLIIAHLTSPTIKPRCPLWHLLVCSLQVRLADPSVLQGTLLIHLHHCPELPYRQDAPPSSGSATTGRSRTLPCRQPLALSRMARRTFAVRASRGSGHLFGSAHRWERW